MRPGNGSARWGHRWPKRIADDHGPELITLIVGEDVVLDGAGLGSGKSTDTEPVLEAVGVSAEGLPGPINFSLCRGEILGFTGSIEAGHHALGELVFGLVRRSRGRCTSPTRVRPDESGSRARPRRPIRGR